MRSLHGHAQHAVILLGAGVALQGCSSARTPYSITQQSAESYAARGDFAAAQAEFERYARNDSTSIDVVANYAAIVAADAAAARLAPDAARLILQSFGARSQESIVLLTRAIALQPSYALTYSLRGISYFELAQMTSALADQERAIALDSTLALAYVNRGILMDTDSVPSDRAIADFTRAIVLDRTMALPYYNRAIAYRKRKQWDLAIADANRVIELRPAAGEGYYSRARTRYEQYGCLDAISGPDAEKAWDRGYAPGRQLTVRGRICRR